MKISEMVEKASQMKASDIHLIFGLPAKCRAIGKIVTLDEEVLTDEACDGYAKELAGDKYEEFLKVGELDMAATFGETRVRINILRQQEHSSIVIRLLNNKIPMLETLGLPPAVEKLADLKRGIVIVTGQTGSGKSTTLASLIDRINHSRSCHVVTLEDPIEYVYTPDKAIFNQREIGRDTRTYATGLRAALREDPDVILIGEMRDTETIETALTAAETGHLVLATLHTGSAAETVDRIVNVFPGEKQQQIRMQLSTTLISVLSQQLLPTKDGTTRVPACEYMIVTPAVRNLIRDGKTPQIDNVISTTAEIGSITMDNAILKLYKEKRISGEVAKDAARNVEYISKSVF